MNTVIVILDKDHRDGEVDCIGVATNHDNAIKIVKKYYGKHEILSEWRPEQGDDPYLKQTIKVEYDMEDSEYYDVYYMVKEVQKL